MGNIIEAVYPASFSMNETIYVPFWKNFTIDLETKEGEVVYRLRLSQSSLGETIARKQWGIAQRAKWFDNLLVDSGLYVVNGEERKVPADFHKDRIDRILIEQGKNFVGEVLASVDKPRESLYEGINKMPEKNEKIRQGTIIGHTMMMVCKRWNLNGMKDLLENYTYEQYGFMVDAMTFDGYERTENGMIANDQIFNKGGLSEERKSQIDYYKKLAEQGVL